MLRAAALLALALLLAAPLAGGQDEGPRPVLQLTVEGPITRGTDLYIEDGLALAERENAAALLLVLNTPGGGLEETFRITDRISNSRVPVIGYVAPRTATAWSAGTVILLSTHVAGMAPFTVIGSSQPVALGEGGFTPINDSKIINALVGKLRALAALHGRNETAAEEFVTKNLNLNAEDALRAQVVEINAPDERALLQAADGRVVETAAGNVTLRVAGSPIRPIDPAVRVVLLDIFFDPVIAGLLLLVGIYALIFGLGAPGHGAEVGGAVLILLALVGLGFSVNLVALGLIALGAVLLLLELHTPGFGVFGIAGILALVLGTLFIAPLNPTGPGQWSFPAQYQTQVLLLLAAPSLIFAGFLVFALIKVQQARRRKPFPLGTVVGEEAEVTDPIAPGKPGFVTLHGERWQAVSEWGLAPGKRVVVRGKDGPVLRVEPSGGPGSSAPPAQP
ncbi:MAG TPA: nodulation protein NfeD [Candidatus Thermoplasmatota archaeon]|jgi:membrane-bound serine protease (ClpP class)|nr:nodulation protein NfeD [Candidatus Thermoplasmatota archaeon]